MTISRPNDEADQGTVETQVEGAVGRLILSRPHKHNSCTSVMWQSIPGRLDELSARTDVAVIAIQGAGSSFCSGADLNDVRLAAGDRSSSLRYCNEVASALVAIARCPTPTVAVMRGVAAGGGVEIALAADFRYMDRTGTMMLPQARLGVVPDRFTLRRLLGLVGPALARQILLAGTTLDAEASLNYRLIDVLTDSDLLEAQVVALANKLEKNSKRATAGIKAALLYEEGTLELSNLADQMAESMASEDVAQSAERILSRDR